VLDREEARALIAAIDSGSLTGLRDRALIDIMVYTFARIGAVLQMNVGDYFSQGRRGWVRLHEKGGKDTAPREAGRHQDARPQSLDACNRHHRLPKSDGSLSEARKMANHADTRTTQLYDRRGDSASLDEYGKVGI
jgi:integrase